MYKSFSLITLLTILTVLITITFNTKKISNYDMDKIKNSVFKLISLSEERGLHTATGFVFEKRSGKSFILTNHHFCNITDGGLFLIQNHEEYIDGSARIAEVEYSSQEVDLCIASTMSYEPALNIKNDNLYFSERLYTIGAPDGNFPMYFELRFSSYLDKNTIRDFFPTLRPKHKSFFVTGAVDSGQSGSPVFNSKGDVVGVVFAKTGNSTGVVISAEEALEFISGFFSY